MDKNYYIFWLLCCVQKLDNHLLNKLINSFKSISNMYIISYNSLKFKEILIKNNLFFSNDILKKLLNSKLKFESKKLYINLVQKEIHINKIKVADKYIYTCTYGNISILSSKLKKQYIFFSEKSSNYGKLKYEYFLNNINIKENINVCISNQNLRKNSSNVIIQNICNMSELRSINTECFNKNNLYIFNSYDIYSILLICDNLFLIEAKCERNIVNLVNLFLDYGKEILVLPGDIWNKNCYFSNFLIQEGANVILNIDDLNNYL